MASLSPSLLALSAYRRSISAALCVCVHVSALTKVRDHARASGTEGQKQPEQPEIKEEEEKEAEEDFFFAVSNRRSGEVMV